MAASEHFLSVFQVYVRNYKGKGESGGLTSRRITQQGVKWLLGKIFTVSFASSFMTARWARNDSMFFHHSSDTKCSSYINDTFLSCVHQTKEVLVWAVSTFQELICSVILFDIFTISVTKCSFDLLVFPLNESCEILWDEILWLIHQKNHLISKNPIHHILQLFKV